VRLRQPKGASNNIINRKSTCTGSKKASSVRQNESWRKGVDSRQVQRLEGEDSQGRAKKGSTRASDRLSKKGLEKKRRRSGSTDLAAIISTTTRPLCEMSAERLLLSGEKRNDYPTANEEKALSLVLALGCNQRVTTAKKRKRLPLPDQIGDGAHNEPRKKKGKEGR